MQDNQKILEALRLQPLSEEEKRSRHILGRLYGPIATFTESTRNDRLYNKQLWENALNDDIFKEKIQNKSLFLELGHPADREETDMTKVCACIPEMPKIVNGDLYGYVDILDTDNGRLLKTLIDYGFVPGISSRGSGDIMDNNEVDPDTFFLETWDIVQLPAVKKARLSVCESLDTNGLKLKKALTESLNKSDEKGREIMEEALNNLNINLKEGTACGECAEPIDEAKKKDEPEDEEPKADDIPETEDKKDNKDDKKDEKKSEKKSHKSRKEKDEEKSSDKKDDKDDKKDDKKDDDKKADNDDDKKDDVPAEPAVLDLEDKAEDEPITVKEFVDLFKDADKKAPFIIDNIVLDDKEYKVAGSTLSGFDKDELHFTLDCVPVDNVADDNKDELPVEDNPQVDIEVNSADATVPMGPEAPVVADDAGMAGVFESLKESIRQKDLLEQKLKTLKSQYAVSNAEVEKLNEELNKYKSGFARTSELAADAKKFEKQAKELTEQLAAKDAQLSTLKESVAKTKAINESVDKNAQKVKMLSAKIDSITKEADDTSKKLTEQLGQYKQRLTERTEQAKGYKAKYLEVMNRYVESKASMLGVRPTDITNRLDEGYTMDDIDNACDQILSEGVKMSRLPFGRTTSKMKITESVKKPTAQQAYDPENGYEVSDDLLELAGLDK